MVPAVVLAALILFFPESPRWLMDKDQHDKALHTLAKLHSAGDASDPWVVAEYEQIKTAIQDEKENGASSLVELFKDKASLRRLILVAVSTTSS